MKQVDSNLLYINMNKSEQYVLTHGIKFHDFVHSLSIPIESVLLLQHKFDDVQLHLHSMFHYIEKEKIQDMMDEDVSRYGEFSWVDFEEIEALDELDSLEIAELLYLNHMKTPLKSAFFQKLNNQFVYLAQDDGWFNKTYYRNLDRFYTVFNYMIIKVMEKEKRHKGFLFFKKGLDYKPLQIETLRRLENLLCEGCVIDTDKIKSTRGKIEIPIYTLGSFWNMDEMQDVYDSNAIEPQATLTYHKKEKGWTIH
ncbi:oxalate:formate antiporter [Bacillus carboniphilus]|uniref:Oxalate:formate antiporter n=1 Tax=Bacillus carboniphilus TaxID=86663 RepID=A0ABP3FQR1_9BACI